MATDKYTDEELLQAVVSAGGCLTDAAEALSIDRSTFYKRADTRPDFAEALQWAKAEGRAKRVERADQLYTDALLSGYLVYDLGEFDTNGQPTGKRNTRRERITPSVRMEHLNKFRLQHAEELGLQTQGVSITQANVNAANATVDPSELPVFGRPISPEMMDLIRQFRKLREQETQEERKRNGYTHAPE